MKYRFFSLFGFIVLLAGSVGCGQGNVLKTDKVDGVVTLDGAPLEGATVNFYVEGGAGNPGFGITNAEGRFLLQTMHGAVDAGTTPGNYIATVSKKVEVPTGRKVMGGDNSDEPVDEMTRKETLPDQYTKTKTSPFKVTVEAGKVNSYTFDLQSK